MNGTELPQNNAHEKALKVLAVHRYYWPDTPPYATILRRIVCRWREDGHHVDVLSSQPSYKAELNNRARPAHENIDGVNIYRLRLPNESGRPLMRLLNALRLCFALLWRAYLGRYDVIMISTVPPVIGGVAAALASRLTGARFVYHCMDIHPEIGRISGEFSNRLVFRVLLALDSWSCKSAKPVVVLSQDMANALRDRPKGDRFQIEVLNNFSLPEDSASAEIPFDLSKKEFKILFAGNIGRFQGLDTVLAAMDILKVRDDIAFLFMGEGAMRELLETKANKAGLNVRFLGHQSIAVAKAAMRKVQVGFVSLTPGLFRYAYPSKTMTYLEQGCPLLVAVESESELAREVEEKKIGRVIPAGDVQSLADTIREMADSPESLTDFRKAAKQLANDCYSESAVLPCWSELLKTDRTQFNE